MCTENDLFHFTKFNNKETFADFETAYKNCDYFSKMHDWLVDLFLRDYQPLVCYLKPKDIYFLLEVACSIRFSKRHINAY